jgi:putative transposase
VIEAHTSEQYQQLLKGYGIRASLGKMGVCWYHAVVERFFGSLKHAWIIRTAQPTSENIKQDVAAYMRYYNQDRLYSANDDVSAIQFEQFLLKVSSST